jgi:hypothetical protein
MKKIEITPEWILKALPMEHIALGQGKIIIVIPDINDYPWIELALDTIGVKYQCEIFDNLPDQGEDVFLSIQYEFRIEDIKEECPILYAEWKKIDLINSFRKN